MPNYDEKVRFEAGGDSGENEAASIQPVGGRENYVAVVLNRPPENLRQRVETLRGAVETLNYVADYDRALILSSTGTVSIKQDAGGLYRVKATQPLYLRPALTPGATSGGRAGGARLFLAGVEGLGTAGVNDLHVVADRAHTGQRGYADGAMTTDVATTLSVGANDISVELVAEARTGGAGNIHITITGTPKRHVKIAWGTAAGGTTLADLIATVNADRTSQTTFGAADYIRLSTTSPGTSTSIPTCAATVLQGGYDAEAHKVLPAQLDDFFNTAANLLADKEGLAIAFTAGPVEFSAPGGHQGGRRQALEDQPTNRIGTTLDNTMPAVGNNLFNTGREPEKIPGALPLGKIVDGQFVFVDGTAIPLPSGVGNETAQYALGESPHTLTRLADTTLGASGAMLIGYREQANWHADSGPDSLEELDVQRAIDEIMTDLAGTGAGNSGARRIGAEAQTGTATTGNTASNLSAVSIRQQLLALLELINRRVSENGHRLHTAAPLEKHFVDDTAGGGGTMTRAVLNAPPSGANASGQVTEIAHAVLQPYTYDFGGVNTLAASEDIDAVGTANDEVRFTNGGTMTGARLTTFVAQTRVAGGFNDVTAQNVDLMLVELSGVTAGAGPAAAGSGFYYLHGVSVVGPNGYVALRNLDGSTPSFATATFSSAKIKFYQTLTTGNDAEGRRLKIFTGNMGANGTPFGVVATDDDNQILLAVYAPTQHAGTSGPSTVIGTQSAQWHIGSVVRDTGNILVTGDKSLLDGVETSAPTDASANHTHGSFTNEILYTSPVDLYNATLAGKSLDTWYASGAAIPPAVTHGPNTLRAVLLNVEISLVSDTITPASMQLVSLGVDLGSGTNVIGQVLLHEYGYNAPGSALAHKYRAQLIVPVDGANKVYFRIPTADLSEVTLANVTLKVTQVGQITSW